MIPLPSPKACAYSPSRPQACGVKNVNISVAKSGPEGVLKKDPAAEKAPDAGAVASDKADAMFAAHATSSPAVFWSKFTRPTGPPTAPTSAVKGALKKDIPAAESGAEPSVDEAGLRPTPPPLKPVTTIDAALTRAAVCGETLPSIKEFPEPAQAASALLLRRAPADPLLYPTPLSLRRATTAGPSRPRSFLRRSPPRRRAPHSVPCVSHLLTPCAFDA